MDSTENDGGAGEEMWCRITPKGLALVELWHLGVPVREAEDRVNARFPPTSDYPPSWRVALWCKWIHWRLRVRRWLRIKDAPMEWE